MKGTKLNPGLGSTETSWMLLDDRLPARSGQSGFTLLELLVVVAVLGVLGGVTVVAAGSLGDGASSAACAIERRTLQTAQEAHLSLTGAYGTQDELVSAGLLRSPSTSFDVVLSGEGYSLVPDGGCVGGPDEVASDDGEDSNGGGSGEAEDPATPTTSAPATPAPTRGCSGGQVDLNSASIGDLQQLSHVNRGRAIQVVDARPYGSVRELEGVGGLNASRVDDIVAQGLACV